MLGCSRLIFSFAVLLVGAEATEYTATEAEAIVKDVEILITKNGTKESVEKKVEQQEKAEPYLHDKSGIGEYVEDLWKIIQSDPCKQDCFVTSVEWKNLQRKLVKYLTNLDAVNPEHTVENNDDTYKLVITNLMKKSEDVKKGSEQIVRMAIMKSTFARTGKMPSFVNVFPELLASTYEQPEGSNDYQSGSGEPQHMNFRVAEPEHKLDYWREENTLHIFHAAWHAMSDDRNPRDRRGERFYYMHRNMIFRYFIERYVMGLPDTVTFDKQERTKNFTSKYNVEANTEDRVTLQGFESATEYCTLSDQQERNMTETEADIDGFLSEAENLNEYANQLSVAYHGEGHRAVSLCAPSGDYTAHIMWRPATSARDPLFYRWHKEVEAKVENYLAQKPYNVNELSPATGIQVSEVEVHDLCGKANQLETFLDEVPIININKTFYGINHDEFKLIIKLQNSRRSSKRVMIRIFLGLEEFIDTGKWYISIDKFAYQLTGQTDETIEQSELQSSYTYSGEPYDESSCKWPQRLLIPRGSDKQPTKFRFVVFVHDIENQQVNEGMTTELSNVFCGAESSSIVTDPREYGFPFGRAWQGINKADVMNNRDEAFGKISTPIEISYKGRRTGNRTCTNTNESTTETPEEITSESSVAPTKTPADNQTETPEEITSESSVAPTKTPADNQTETPEEITSESSVAPTKTPAGWGAATIVSDLEPRTCYFGRCYRVSLNPVTWQAGKSLCEKNGLELVKHVYNKSFIAMMKHEKNKHPNKNQHYWTAKRRRGRRFRGYSYCLAKTFRGKLTVGKCNKREDGKRVREYGRWYEFIYRAVCQKPRKTYG